MYMFTDLIWSLVRELVYLMLIAIGLFSALRMVMTLDTLIWLWGLASVLGVGLYLLVLLVENRPVIVGLRIFWIDRTFPFLHTYKGRGIRRSRRRSFWS